MDLRFDLHNALVPLGQVGKMQGALEEAERKAFLTRYQAEVEKAYRTMPDGTVLLPFPRLFIVATR